MNPDEVNFFMNQFNVIVDAMQKPLREGLSNIPEEEFNQMNNIDVHEFIMKIFEGVSREYFLEQDRIAKDYIKKIRLENSNMKIIK